MRGGKIRNCVYHSAVLDAIWSGTATKLGAPAKQTQWLGMGQNTDRPGNRESSVCAADLT